MNKWLLIASLSLTAGCWTFNETEYPQTPASAAPTTGAPSLQLAGFAANTMQYDTVYSTQTVYTPGYYGHRYYHPGYVETVPTTSYVPRYSVTDHYLRRARNAFEKAGYVIAPSVGERLIEVDFEGPFISSSEYWKALSWQVGTIFFCDYGAAKWTAKLRIRDGKTGKVLFTNDYEQRFETHVFGLLPLFGISASNATSIQRMQTWCLSALTDKIVAETTAYLNHK